MHIATKLGLMGVCSGILLSCLLLVIAGSDDLTLDLAVLAFVYGAAAVGVLLSELVSSLRRWILLVAAVPLFLWTLVGTLGAGDPTSILGFILYVAAIVTAFRAGKPENVAQAGEHQPL